jgi:hypothetical protein
VHVVNALSHSRSPRCDALQLLQKLGSKLESRIHALKGAPWRRKRCERKSNSEWRWNLARAVPVVTHFKNIPDTF